MTRKQAEKIAERIVAAAHKAAPMGVRWTQQEIEVTREDRDALDEHGGLIVGCLPLGFRLGGVIGSNFVIVHRERIQ